MMNVKIVVTGVKALDDTLRRIPPALNRSIARTAARRAAKPLLEIAKQRIPQDSGKFRTTLKIHGLPRLKVNRNVVGVRVITDEPTLWGIHPRIRSVFNAVWAEFGVPGHLAWGSPNPLPARPWMRPSMHAARPLVMAAWVAEMRSLLSTKFWGPSSTP